MSTEDPHTAVSGRMDTPVKTKHVMDRTRHANRDVIQDSVRGSVSICAVESFAKYYLRKGQDVNNLPENWEDTMVQFENSLKNCKSESAMYPYIVILLTSISLTLNANSDSVLAFYATGDAGCKHRRPFPSHDLRPDIIAKYVTRKEAQSIVNSKEELDKLPEAPNVYWTDIESIIEVKKEGYAEIPAYQTLQYAHILSRPLPNLAGMLLLSCDKEKFHFFWSDTSGAVRSQQFDYQSSLSYAALSGYVRTVCHPFKHLPTRDSTMTHHVGTPPGANKDTKKGKGTKGQGSKEVNEYWEIRTKKCTYNAILISATTHHSRQACVFHDYVQKRVIKDHWRDVDRGFREGDLLKKIEGIPFVVQLESSEQVEDPGLVSDNGSSDEEPADELYEWSDEELAEVKLVEEERTEEDGVASNIAHVKKIRVLATSKLHSGLDPKINEELGERKVPRRVKERSVLKSFGKHLSERKSVLQLLKAFYDSLTGYQLALKEEDVMHRDISRGNILIEPEHHDCTFREITGAVPINKVLDENLTDAKEEGVLIDFDNAADLKETRASEALAGRTGTPMFISIGVGMGAIRVGFPERPGFPLLSGKAREKYCAVYGEQYLAEYPEKVNKTDTYKSVMNMPLENHPVFQHRPYHDGESFFWVLLYELMLAWPKDAKEEESAGAASDLILKFRLHTFGKNITDSRVAVLGQNTGFFESLLHPRLKKVAGLLFRMAQYASPEWAFWNNDDLPRDHVQEAFRRLILETCVMLVDEKDPIELRKKFRGENVKLPHYFNSVSQSTGAIYDTLRSPTRKHRHNKRASEADESEGNSKRARLEAASHSLPGLSNTEGSSSGEETEE